MTKSASSIRPFLGAKDFMLSRAFYRDWGFIESVLSPELSVFRIDQLAFYLQDAYVKDWIDNTMVFLEVENIENYYNELLALNLTGKYKEVKLSVIKVDHWGSECFLHDPSGILWHIGEFKSK
ncbi:glyoxalase [Dyadobacter sp. CY356]|uniref:glyoxalase n=1 Tax=Dyadobacter sp. CY356 TaxID=2906442 RepID=UPI001F3C7A5D|nr:glyoxalase [Dyadobacter sp. CY356]MCF0055273.1 glyoxalase [Dyadobacter sp. CY356]